jgi:8-oxo-dGTP pyrophosphatase MutT (NUDIX family)
VTDLRRSSAAAASETHAPASLHADALSLLEGWQPPGRAQDEVRRGYLAHLEAHQDGMRRDCFPAHLTASAIVLSEDLSLVLLTLHAKANAWFQLGGHCESGDLTLAGAALREAVEESGLAALALDPDPVQLDAHEVGFCNPGGTVTHLDVRFLAVADSSSSPTVSAESVDVRWWPVDDLPSQEPGLVELVHLARRRALARR